MSGLRILLVEDDAGDRLLIEQMLAGNGGDSYVFRPCDRLAEAIRLLEAESFDAILCDLSLPDADGVEVVESLRRVASDLPIVVLTGREDPAFSVAMIERGVQDYLTKREMSGSILRRTLRHALERQKLLAQIRTSVGRLQSFFEHGQVGMAIVGETGEWEFRNDRASALFGIDRQATPPLTRLVHPADRETLSRMLQGEATARNTECDLRVLRADGGRAVLRFSLAPLASGDERRRWTLLLQDVSEQTRLARRDGTRRQVLAGIAEGTPLVRLLEHVCTAIAAEIDGTGVALATRPDGNSPEIVCCGAGPDHESLQAIAGRCLLTPAYVADAATAAGRELDPARLADLGFEAARGFPGKLRLFAPPNVDDGKKLVIVVCDPASTDSEDVPSAIRFAGELANLAIQKVEARQAQELAASVFATSEQGIVVTDRNNRIVSVNDAFCRILGYAPQEVMGQSPSVWKSGHHTPEFYRRMWHALLSKGGWQGEILDRKKSGELIALWMSVSTVADERGVVQRHVSMLTDITARKEAEAVIARQANFDALTGLPNRRLFLDRLDQELARARRSGAHVALFFVDLDHFKEVNDTLGHEVGDQLLQQAGDRIRACVRAADTVARLGGDEFTVLLPELVDPNDAELVAGKIVAALAEPFILGDEKVALTASLGITLFPDDSSDPRVLLRNADQAMYQAKGEGRARFSYFTQEMQAQAVRRLRLHQDLLVALEQDQFEVHYQPIVDGRNGHLEKVEALVRWQHPDKGMISPGHFIPVAEEVGLIVPIGDWVFGTVLADLARFDAAGLDRLAVSVNKSPRHFIRDGNDGGWLNRLREFGVPGERIILEITEGLLLDSRPEVYAKLCEYRDAGVRIAIDDFGTGYSALGYLKRFPIDIVKIDRSFISDLGTDPSARTLVEAIVVMAQKLGIEVIAEGVETEEQRALLLDIGSPLMQGYLFSRPVPLDVLTAARSE